MNITKFVPNSVTRRAGLAALKASKHSPTILFGAGVVGFGATVVLAARATLKLEDVINDAQKDLYIIETDRALNQNADRDKAHVYFRTGVRITKLYGPALIVGGLSVAALTGSHRILTARNAGLTAAYAVLEKSYDEYRERVRTEVGVEKEKDLYLDACLEDVEIEGSKKKAKVRRGGTPSRYARFFDQTNPYHQVDPEANRIYIEAQQTYLQQRLNQWGWVSLNDAYERLGLERTKEGQQVGWVVTRAGIADKGGDPYVDFGLGDWPSASDYVNGREVGILLDFNVTTLLDKI